MSGLAMLSPPSAARLAKLAGMIGSDHDGEALNAARAATRLLAFNGLTWIEALAAPMPQAVPMPHRSRNCANSAPGPYPVPPTTAFYRKVVLCLGFASIFDPVEVNFIRSMDALCASASRRQPSEKQAAWLDRLHCRAVMADAGRGS